MSKPPPDTSWVHNEEISDGPNPVAWAMFLFSLVMVVATIVLLFS